MSQPKPNKEKLTFEHLQAMVQMWAKNKGIYDDPEADAYTQLDKMSEEFNELQRALSKRDVHTIMYGRSYGHLFDDLNNEVKDGFGDILVCLINAAHFAEVDLIDALKYAYKQIAPRTGKMVNGKLVKDQ